TPLWILFNKSLMVNQFPNIWKTSFVKPIFKSGNRNEVTNYRGVCNQSAVPKIFESIVAKQLQWTASKDLINQQHGFCKNKSTLSNLLEYYSFLNESFSKNSQVDVIYTDYAKAFDRVNHDILILKLSKLGFRQSTVGWLASFLTNRRQQVKIGNYLSDPFKVTCTPRLSLWSNFVSSVCK